MPPHRAWSIPLGRFGRVPVRLHLSFVLLAALVAFDASSSSETFFAETSFVLALLLAVIVHECAHVAVALRLGVQSRECVLYPFGGVTTYRRELGPRAELAIACAGPVANAIAAIMLAPAAELVTEPSQFITASFLTKLFAANVVMIVFNFVPAFPLDGGTILRSVLALIPVKHPTETVARVSQGTGVLLGVLALLTLNIFLVVMAAVIFGSALREMVRQQALRVGAMVRIGAIMIEAKQLMSFSHGTSLPDAVNRSVRSFQPLFPVTHVGGLLGYVTKDDLLHAAARGEENDYVGSVVEKQFLAFPSTALASEVSEAMAQQNEELAFIIDDGQFLGLVTREKLIEFLLLKDVRSHIEDAKSGEEDGPFL